MSRELAHVRRAARQRNQGETRYREAITAARAAGHTLAGIAAAAGTSKQAVSQLLKRTMREEA